MKYRVVMGPQAESDAMSAWLFIAADSSRAADRWFAGLTRAVESLSDRPEQNPTAVEAEGSGQDVRRVRYGKYKILYYGKADTVRMLRIYHGARWPLSPEDLVE